MLVNLQFEYNMWAFPIPVDFRILISGKVHTEDILKTYLSGVFFCLFVLFLITASLLLSTEVMPPRRKEKYKLFTSGKSTIPG